MRREPIVVEGLDDLCCSNIKLSARLRWRDSVAEDQYIMIPSLLALCVVDAAGNPVKSIEEWDEWAGENPDKAQKLFSQCTKLVGTAEAAEKK